MAGLAYIYQGEQISFDNPEFNDPQFGTMRFNMNVGGSKVKHGFTSDVSASQYCSLKFRINSSQTARIGRQRTRSRVSSEPEHTETWSGTGYVSTTGEYEKIIPQKTIWTGEATTQSFSTSYLSSKKAFRFNSDGGWYTTGVAGTCTTYYDECTASSSTFTYESNSESHETGRSRRYTALTEAGHNHGDDSGSLPDGRITRYAYWTSSSRDVTSITRTYQQYDSDIYKASTALSVNYTYGLFTTDIMPQRTETLTATYETLHNYNL